MTYLGKMRIVLGIASATVKISYNICGKLLRPKLVSRVLLHGLSLDLLL